MTEKQAQEIMEKTIINGTPHPNTFEYMEALEISIDMLGADYTREQLKNWVLCGKYPFLIPRYDWSGKIIEDYDYTSTYLDDIPVGWKKTFGEMMCEEIKQELVKCNYLEEFRIIQAKEKFGGLRIYTNGEPIGCKVQEIIDKYSVLSENICIICGKPDVPMIDSGWISPYCKKCYTTPSDWYKEEHSDKIDEWTEFRTDEWNYFNNKDNNNIMLNSYTVEKWSKEKGDETITYDISETANKIRMKWKSEYK